MFFGQFILIVIDGVKKLYYIPWSFYSNCAFLYIYGTKLKHSERNVQIWYNLIKMFEKTEPETVKNSVISFLWKTYIRKSEIILDNTGLNKIKTKLHLFNSFHLFISQTVAAVAFLTVLFVLQILIILQVMMSSGHFVFHLT